MSPKTSAASDSSCSPVDEPSLRALAQQRADLLLAVGLAAGFGGRGDAERLEDQVAHPVEQVDQRLRGEVKAPHERRHHQHHALGARDGEALGRELADHHVQGGDDQEGDCARQPDARDLGAVAQHRLEQLVEGRLAQRAQSQGGHRDAELARREVGVYVRDGVGDRLGPRLSLAQQLVDLGGAQPRHRELRGHEEPVGRHQDNGEDELDGHRWQRLVR